LIVDVDFAHLGLHMLVGLGLERHVCFLFLEGIMLRRFLNTAFPLQVVTLGASMCRNRNGIVMALEMEKLWIRGRNDSPFHDFRLCDEQLELCN
jgi:hypothetical protein